MINSSIVGGIGTYREYEHKLLQAIREVIKYRRFLVSSDNFQMVNVGNCYVVVDNGQIYIGEYDGK